MQYISDYFTRLWWGETLTPVSKQVEVPMESLHKSVMLIDKSAYEKLLSSEIITPTSKTSLNPYDLASSNLEESRTSVCSFDPNFYDALIDSLLAGLSEEYTNLSQSQLAEVSLSDLGLSFLKEFDNVVKEPIIIMVDNVIPSLQEGVSIFSDIPSPPTFTSMLEPCFKAALIAPDDKVEDSTQTCANQMEKVQIRLTTIPPPPPGLPPLIQVNPTAAKHNHFSTQIQLQAQKKIQALRDVDPIESQLVQELNDFQRLINRLVDKFGNNPVFLVKYPALIKSYLDELKLSNSVEDLTESRLYNTETSKYIVNFCKKYPENYAAHTRLRALLKENLQKLKQLTSGQVKKQEELNTCLDQHKTRIDNAKLAQAEQNFATKQKEWLSFLPHKQFKNTLSTVKLMKLWSALMTAAGGFDQRYSIKECEDLRLPIAKFNQFRKQVKHATDLEQLNALTNDYQFWSMHFVSHLPEGFVKRTY